MEDKDYMRIAIKLAKRGRTSPNPKVGAVLVKNGKIIGKGYHKKAGMPHAEVEAFNSVKNRKLLVGAALYVTLEPCSHTDKRTPPCTNSIIANGIGKVVFGMEDSNPKVNGIEQLRSKGIKVEQGLLKREAEELNIEYNKIMKTGLPYVTMKIGMSFDGKITTNSDNYQCITCDSSRGLVQKLRDENSGIMVGIGTVLKDNPRLTCRIKDGVNPIRIIVDSELKIPLDSNVLVRASGMVIIGTTRGCDQKKKIELEKLGVRVIISDVFEAGKLRVDLTKFLKEIGKLGVNSILLEGGSELNASMVKEKLVDRFLFLVAPVLIGGRNTKGPIGGDGILEIKDAYKLEFRKVRRVGMDILIEAIPN